MIGLTLGPCFPFALVADFIIVAPIFVILLIIKQILMENLPSSDQLAINYSPSSDTGVDNSPSAADLVSVSSLFACCFFNVS